MRNAPLYRCMVGLILISATLGASFQQPPQQVRMEQNPLARARKHIVDCVEPLCREVLPHEAKLLFLATPVASTSVRSRRAQVWTVDCLDAGSEQRLHLLWNAESNRLVSLHQVNLQRPFLSGAFVSKTQAIRESGDWMKRLAIVPHGGAQHCACTVDTQSNAYDIHFRLKEQSVSVGINTHSDALLFVYVNSVTPRP